MRRAVARVGADVLRLRRLRVESELHRLAQQSAAWSTRGRGVQTSLRWRLELPESLDEVLKAQSTRTRGNHRRYARKLEEEFGDRLSFQLYRDPSDLDRVVRDCESVSSLTYQQRLGAGFAANAAELRLVEEGARRGWLRAYVLYVDGAPQAFWIGLAYNGVLFTGPTGYNPELASLRLGTYVLMRMIDDVCKDDDVRVVDFGIGDAEYKRHFGSESWLEEDGLLFAPTLRGVRVNLTRAALIQAATAARNVAESAPALRNVKRRWRARLSGGTA
jgi:CelD/BcsL family acetyltransferase involved in cellulose biosynthesis